MRAGESGSGREREQDRAGAAFNTTTSSQVQNPKKTDCIITQLCIYI